MKKSFSTFNWLFVLGIGFFLTASCKNNEPKPNNDVVNLALTDSRLTVFTKLLTDNDLVSTFDADEPYTIFAPTNEAFSKIDISKLTKAELLKLLNTHIVTKRRLLASDIKSGVVRSPNVEIYLSKNPSGVFVNGTSKVVSPDILSSNSVIHVIDNVIIPPAKSLLETLRSNPNFSEFVSFVALMDNKFEENHLIYPSPIGITMLAPTNVAFEELYKTIPKATLLADRKRLNEILRFHVISSRVFTTDLQNINAPINTFMAPIIGISTAATSGSEPFTITNSFTGQYQVVFDMANGLKVRGVRSGHANLTNVNLLATNGVVHAIDRVLLP